jgi:AcrR family transcriptional regulator
MQKYIATQFRRRLLISPAMPNEEGLRALKKRRTRRDIVAATLELTIEHSYRGTTIAMIAERALVSPRTVSTYFPNKDEIPFDGGVEALEDLAARLQEREGPLIERLRQWIADREPERDLEFEVLRAKAITGDPDLRLAEHRYLDGFADLVATAVAEEVGIGPDEPGPQTFAAAFVGVLLAIRTRLAADTSNLTPEDYLDSGFKFLESGLAGLRRDAATI